MSFSSHFHIVPLLFISLLDTPERLHARHPHLKSFGRHRITRPQPLVGCSRLYRSSICERVLCTESQNNPSYRPVRFSITSAELVLFSSFQKPTRSAILITVFVPPARLLALCQFVSYPDRGMCGNVLVNAVTHPITPQAKWLVDNCDASRDINGGNSDKRLSTG